jgi:hypothetical protein
MSSSPPRDAALPWLPQAELAALHTALTEAEHSKIVRLVAAADTLRQRGAVDDLIAPFRTRLAHMAPARPLRFARLLFMPLDPLVVVPAHWQPKSPMIPRSALLPMAETVFAAMGEDAARIERMIEGYTTRDQAVVVEAGTLLWPTAARVLARCAPPPGWTEQTGFPAAIFSSIAVSTGAVFEQVLTLQTWRAEAQLGIFVGLTALQQILQQVGKGRPEALGMFIALMLARLPKTARLLRGAIAEVGWAAAAEMRAAMESAIASLLERLELENGIETMILRTALGEAGAEVSRVADVMVCRDLKNAAPAQALRMSVLRRRLDESCRLRFTIGLQADFLQVLEALGSKADTADMIRLEGAARGLRELSDEARRIGSAGLYDTLLRQSTDAIKAIGPDGAFSLADKVRLVEILAGSDEAWTLLDDAPA